MFFFQAEDGIRDSSTSRGLGDVYKRQLLGQDFVINPDLTVEAAAKEAGVEIISYVRMAVGEGIEKIEEDFAAEVAKAAQG